MSSGIQVEKFRRNGSRLPSDSKSHSLRLSSGIQDKSSGTRTPQPRGEHQKPEQDLTSRHWTNTSQGFPPGVTVDELKHYRRRRQVSQIRPQDNLQPEEGSSASYKSEYTRRYKTYDRTDVDLSAKQPAANDPSEKTELKLQEEEERTSQAEGKEPAKEPWERTVLKRPKSNLQLSKEEPIESATEKRSQYVAHMNPERRKLLRRSTALKPEGEMVSETEVRSQFREYENPEKTLLIRRPPSLRLEGDFERLTTEQKESFIAHLLGERPVLKKKSTMLKMEGDFDFLTEKQVSYVRHSQNERRFPRKRSTSLKLDGEVEFFPEYRSSYVDFPRSRPITYKPLENLRNEGEIESQTETKTKFVGFQDFSPSLPARPTNNLQMEGGLEIKPEYKETFIDFPRSRPFTMRPENNLKQEGDLGMNTEMREELSKILLEDTKKPSRVRRESNLKLEGELEFSTEKRDQFKGHEILERLPPARREGNLLLEGEFDFKTENEDKYAARTAPPGPGDFRKRSSFLRSGGEFQSIHNYGRSSPRQPLSSPNRARPTEGQPVKSKLIPYKTEYFGLDSELVDNCNRRTSRRNSKRLKENFSDEATPFATIPRATPVRREENLNLEDDMEKSPEYRSQYVHYPLSVRPKVPPSDRLRLDTADYSSCSEKRAVDPMAVINRPFDVKPEGKSVKEKDGNISDTSDTSSVARQQPSFRLEVYNVDANPQGFHRGSQRVFPAEGIPTDTIHYGPDSFLEKKRNEYYGKNVNCPEVPNYILDKNNNVGGDGGGDLWDLARKEDALNVINGNPRVGFTRPGLLDISDDKLSSPTTAVDREPETWSRPHWLAT